MFGCGYGWKFWQTKEKEKAKFAKKQRQKKGAKMRKKVFYTLLVFSTFAIFTKSIIHILDNNFSDGIPEFISAVALYFFTFKIYKDKI